MGGPLQGLKVVELSAMGPAPPVGGYDVGTHLQRGRTTVRANLKDLADLTANPRLVYGRITGWGQDGPLAQSAGPDINDIALAGALHAMGPAAREPAGETDFDSILSSWRAS